MLQENKRVACQNPGSILKWRKESRNGWQKKSRRNGDGTMREKIKKEEASTAIFDKDKQPSEKGTDTVVPETNEE